MSLASTNIKSSAGQSEHISLESDLSETRAKPNPSRPLVQFHLSKSGRGLTKCVSILADQFVAVEMRRSGSAVDLHTVDMRFIDSRPIGVRKVQWPCLWVALGATAFTAIAIALYMSAPNLTRKIGGLLLPIGFGALAFFFYAVCYYLTSESLLFLSVHGRARVITIVGRLGTIRRSRNCAAEVAKQIRIAQKQFQQPRQAHLRDEMREHSRLKEQGVFTEEQYQEAMRRILKSHE